MDETGYKVLLELFVRLSGPAALLRALVDEVRITKGGNGLLNDQGSLWRLQPVLYRPGRLAYRWVRLRPACSLGYGHSTRRSAVGHCAAPPSWSVKTRGQRGLWPVLSGTGRRPSTVGGAAGGVSRCCLLSWSSCVVAMLRAARVGVVGDTVFPACPWCCGSGCLPSRTLAVLLAGCIVQPDVMRQPDGLPLSRLRDLLCCFKYLGVIPPTRT